MDKLKSFIENNKEEFENISLPEGHEERFASKLSGQSSARIRRYTLFTLASAASIAILFLFLLPSEWFQNKLQEVNEVCENREEFEELKSYYEMQIFDIVAQMEEIRETSDSPAIAGLMEASRQVISATKRFEKNILPELPCSGDGIFALSQHYTISLQNLHMMLDQMEQFADNETNN